MVELEEARAAALIARELYDLREKAGWSHRELARRAGTTQAAIRRLEDADYDDQPLEILQRTAHVLGRRVDMRLRPMRSKRKTA